MESSALAKKISELAHEMKAANVKVLDLSKLSSFTDYFVICSGTSDRQIRAIADKVIDGLKALNVRPVSKEGYEQGEWVLVDYADVVLHVFSEASRQHYDLEGFWNRAPQLKERPAKRAPRKGKGRKPASKIRKSIKSRKSSSSSSVKKAPAKKPKASGKKKKK